MNFWIFSFAVDANSAYGLEDAAHLRKLDGFELLMMEQPLPAAASFPPAATSCQLRPLPTIGHHVSCVIEYGLDLRVDMDSSQIKTVRAFRVMTVIAA
jgi:hypothetical protein